MTVTVFTQNPAALLASIKKAIREKEVETWDCDEDGDFFHTPEQWNKKAWLRPFVQQGVLAFGLIAPTGVDMSKLIYGIYHGRFIEMLLVHFDDKFQNASATALPGSVDQLK